MTKGLFGHSTALIDTKTVTNVRSFFLGELNSHVQMRVQKYVESKDVDNRLQEIKSQVKLNPRTLFVIICDEAHSGATKSTAKSDLSPYSKVVNHWNSTDHPNVIVILVSGTLEDDQHTL